MLTFIPILALTMLAATMLVAAWPLLCHSRLRPIFAGATGTGCIAAGASLIALVMSGLLPGLALTAAAQEEATTKSEAAAPSSTEGSGAPELPSSPEPPAPSPSSADPVLETPPTDEVIIPPGRPSWVEQDPQTDSSGTHTIPVTSGPHKRHIDAVRELEQQLVDETDRYIADYLGSRLAPALLSYDAATIRRDLVKPENIYEEKIISPTTGEMHQIHALIQIDQSFRDRLQQAWQGVRANSRLTQMGLFAGVGLFLIASVFSYFRLDNATRGYYTGRLQFLTAAAILAVIGGSVFAARWIHWL